MSYINPMLGGNYGLGGVQMALAAAYESRIHAMSKTTVARAQFAGDTAVTLTDGSYNSRSGSLIVNTSASSATPNYAVVNPTPGIDIPKSATAQLANTSNSAGTGGKPLVIRALKDSFTAEIYDYAVFNADGTFPGGVNPLQWNATTNRWELNNTARYMVNKETGEIYVNRKLGIMEHLNPDGLVDMDADGYLGPGTTPNNTQTTLNTAPAAAEGRNNVVGIVDFEGLSGGALSSAQNDISNLSTAVQSLTSILRSINENRKGTLSLIR